MDRSSDVPLFFMAVALLVLPILVAFACFEWWRAARALRAIRRSLAGEIEAKETAPEAVARLVAERTSLDEQLLRLRKRVEPLPALQAENASLRDEVEALGRASAELQAELEAKELQLRLAGERQAVLPDFDGEAERLGREMRDALS